ncbi:hypothetical protein EO244_14060 [Ancylomarina salipaludis]|uniref:Phage conserved hypothetical protein C-terminal domain-containing protein n=1 Tax=Ancylomarina salipaludis TaxID=2501299 RepID=A0A4Q1JIP0_9BACT|nr:conserved phage C-terminal domain-containing protein [Ancylomarina salipaludis]RXQ89487.1 hypothetical protein EO244_14060 [Ancylomarina salipaludis]
MQNNTSSNSYVSRDQQCDQQPKISQATNIAKQSTEQAINNVEPATEQAIPQNSMIEGWVKFSRKFYSSEIANKPPHFREIFVWLVVNANHKAARSSGRIINRGQKFTSYQEIQDALRWFVGARKVRYKKHQIEAAMKWLRNQGMVATLKTTRGIIVTIVNYDLYQDKIDSRTSMDQTIKTEVERQSGSTINKKVIIKESKNNYLERDDCAPVGYEYFISEINRLTNKRFRGDKKSRSQFNARMKEGVTVENLVEAVEKCTNSRYHRENPIYLTPEFITRSDKFEKYFNASSEDGSEKSSGKLIALIKKGHSVNEKLKSIKIDLS